MSFTTYITFRIIVSFKYRNAFHVFTHTFNTNLFISTIYDTVDLICKCWSSNTDGGSSALHDHVCKQLNYAHAMYIKGSLAVWNYYKYIWMYGIYMYIIQLYVYQQMQTYNCNFCYKFRLKVITSPHLLKTHLQ